MTSSPQRVALVTGAARGIGLATARRFLAEGWRVALLDIQGELLRNALRGLADPDNTLALPCDVSDEARVGHAWMKWQDALAGSTRWSTMRELRRSRR
jgi:NAD(P)-dependent dehydrogenase (short-subunit alcohol dehydrogenase family)